MIIEKKTFRIRINVEWIIFDQKKDYIIMKYRLLSREYLIKRLNPPANRQL